MSCEPVPSRPAAVAVLGAGTMGRGIAGAAAAAGFATRLHDVDAEALARAGEAVRSVLAGGVERGKLAAEDAEAALARLRLVADRDEALNGAGLVIEAVPERLDLKRRVLAAAAASVAPDCLLASNTSSLSITDLAEGVPGPERVLGLHFFNPVHAMALVEIVRGDRTTERAVERARAFAERLGKTAIVVRDSPGFASSRLGVALGLEAIRMLEENVASAEDIDRAMELGYRHPMGPLRLTDLVGLDVRLEIARHLHRELGGDRFRPPALLEELVRDGRLGRKTGRGFYTWD
ncbi:MAG: 3-hydroxyacyl-CoA dehydrogenase family protein [Gemmatimonadota bacterium]|nr:3-hydroxyacyl-CoA dehydrogenase family protein [Gemmatimonadota bacterium]